MRVNYRFCFLMKCLLNGMSSPFLTVSSLTYIIIYRCMVNISVCSSRNIHVHRTIFTPLLFLIPVSVKLLRCSAKLQKKILSIDTSTSTLLFFSNKKIAVDDSWGFRILNLWRENMSSQNNLFLWKESMPC